MCLDCGCLLPTQDHGDPRHIVLNTLTEAAQASGLPVEQAAANIPRTLRHALGDGDWVATIDAAFRRPTIVVDVDGVLAYTQEAFVAALDAAFGLHLSAAEVTSYWLEDILSPEQRTWLLAQRTQPDVYGNLAPNWHAIDVVNAAYDAGYQVLVATERYPALDQVTREWLDRHQVSRHATHVLGPGNKPLFMRRLTAPAVLIDDDPAKRVTVPRPGVELWVPQQPWTPTDERAGVHVFSDWESVRHRLGV